ncbi:ATP-binding protein [Stygiolobus caldivivus]|uniref:AAA domain-containing protein n=1 Tax=Stygiolobus caldivivus TaxID=2824673 RepID=A0A8D5U846_9CREN|nr:AAA family ATPase [Stygiolobus caldivivus]BCU71103.1 hypothetical protein KN1_24000 [Stygiolobus caldivivus]
MDEELLKIMSEWNFWGEKEPNVGVERDCYRRRILKLLENVKVVAVSGIRRAGKSFIARQVVKKLIVEKGVKPEDTLIIRLDDERLVNPNYELLLKVYDLYLTYVKKGKGLTFLVIDEAQEVEGWERFVRGLEERDEARIIVTGSSAKLLS